MKKLIAVMAMVALSALVLVACAPTSQLNETNTLVARRAIEATDRYLDGGSLDSARSAVERERGNVDDSDEKSFSLDSRLLILQTALTASALQENVTSVREARNGVAELAGIKDR